jgi:hypothetical protein
MKNLTRRDVDKSTVKNKTLLKKSIICGCCYCKRIFLVSKIKEWTDKGKTAICPYCSVDMLICEKAIGRRLTHAFLRQMHHAFFNVHPVEEGVLQLLTRKKMKHRRF